MESRPKAVRVPPSVLLPTALAAVALVMVVVQAVELRRLAAKLDEVKKLAKAADSRAGNAFLHAVTKPVGSAEAK